MSSFYTKVLPTLRKTPNLEDQVLWFRGGHSVWELSSLSYRKIKAFSLHVKIQHYGSNCLQHLQRMYSIHKQAWQYNPYGNRSVGRPEKRWSDHIQEPRRTNKIQTVMMMMMMMMIISLVLAMT
jgi:hypothetical protein